MINVPQEIKNILHQDTCPKNIRIHFPNGERTDICNDLIVMDSVSFKESLCSQNTFKFGLAESPIFECEVVGVSNIKGATIEVSCEIYCPSTVEGAVWQMDIQQYVYPIKYGTFTVFSCDRQTDILHRKIVAYGYTQGVNDGLCDFEIAKLRAIGSSAIYTPSAFLFSMSNFGVTKYDTDVFVPTDIEPTGTENGTQRVLTWVNVNNQNFLQAPFYIEYNLYEISEANADYLYHILIQQRETIDQWVDFIYDFITTINGYRDNKARIRNCIVESELIYTVAWSMGSGKYYGGYVDELVCYPYCNGRTVTIKVPNAFKVNMPLQTMSQHQIIGHYCTSAQIQKLTQQYYNDLNAFRLTIPMGVYGPNFGDGFSNRQVFHDCMELLGCFGNYRDGYMKIVNVRLQYDLPSDEDLYPGTALYPGGDTGGSILPQDYQTCWYDEDYTKPFGRILIYYTNEGDIDTYVDYWIGDYDSNSDPNTYQTYMVTKENLLLKDTKYQEYQIYRMAYEISENIAEVSYMPVKLVGRGLPYVQPGDTFEVLTATNDSITTIVLSRTLKGEMVLTDEYVSVL